MSKTSSCCPLPPTFLLRYPSSSEMRVFLLLLFLCSLVTVASSIKCYVCNSLMNKDCEDNYANFQQFCPVKSFGGKKAVKPLGCRISRQTVKEELSVVRECAYTGTNVERKSQKGSLGVSRLITQCDQPLCNPAAAMASLLLPSAVFLIFRL